MAEDSQYKGELWNKRAIKLLNRKPPIKYPYKKESL